MTLIVDYRPGPRIIAGDLGEAALVVTLTDPWGNPQTVASGHKPEHGIGGFEFLAPHGGRYRIDWDGHSDAFDHPEHGMSWLMWDDTPEPPEPPPETGYCGMVVVLSALPGRGVTPVYCAGEWHQLPSVVVAWEPAPGIQGRLVASTCPECGQRVFRTVAAEG